MGADFHEMLGRFGPIAIIDLAGTIIIVIAIGVWLGWNPNKIFYYIIGALIVGEVVHVAMGIKTPITRRLGLN